MGPDLPTPKASWLPVLLNHDPYPVWMGAGLTLIILAPIFWVVATPHAPDGQFGSDAFQVLCGFLYIGIVSDFGNYAHRWVSWGDKDFRAFLLELGRTDKDYLHSKLGRATCFDHGTTAKTLRQWIVEGRRNESYNKSSARECWDVVKEFETYQYRAEWLYNHLNEEIEDVTEAFNYTYENELKNFVAQVWPRIQDAIRADLEAAGANAS